MQQVVVPQFLDVEDKIIGPISVRQFIELVVGAIIIAILYRLLYFPYFLVSGLIIFSLTIIIAFAKINGQVFHIFMLNFIQTMINPKLKVWRRKINIKEIKNNLKKSSIEIQPPIKPTKLITTSKLSEISLIIDTGGVYQGEEINGLNK